VKVSLAWAAVAACMMQFVFSAATLLAQVPGGSPAGGAGARPISPVAPRSSGTNVAVIDISQVFEKHGQFQAQTLNLKKQVEDFEGHLRGEQQKVVNMRNDLQNYTPGSEQFKRKEEEMARMQSEMNVQMALKRKEFLEKEARLYFDTYNEVFQIVAEVADRNGISLVLRFNSEEMKPEDRASVLQGVNRAVVFQRNLNVTNMVIGEVAKRYPNATTAAPAASNADLRNGNGNGIAPGMRPAGGPGVGLQR
jgi:Skp family chaperone for outer membrane proteins